MGITIRPRYFTDSRLRTRICSSFRYLHGLVGAGVLACGCLGHRLAQRILSRPDRDTVYADRRYPQRFGYHGST